MESKNGRMRRVRHCVLYTADAYGKDGKRFTVLADDKLTAFLKLERQVLMKGEKGLPPATHVVE